MLPEVVRIAVRPLVEAATRSALNIVGQLLIHSFFPLAIITFFDVTPVHVAWIIPFGVALSRFALRFGEATPRALVQSIKLGLYMTGPSILFTIVWPVARVGTVGHMVLMFGASAVVAILFEFAMFLGNFRSYVVERQSRSAEADQEIAAGSDQEIAEPDVSSAKLDARLERRYLRARSDAEEEVRRFLPTNPRTAKRMVNHVSLAMAIAEERRLFDDPEITQQHLAKWIGISEQWPGLGAVLTTAPERMAELEETMSLTSLQQLLDDLAPGTLASKEMLNRLGDDHPLGEMLDRLVRYEPLS